MGSLSFNDMMSAYAEDAVDFAKQRYDITLDFSDASIEQVELIAEHLYQLIPHGLLSSLFKKAPTEDEIDGFCKMLGGYLGEVFRRTKGGDWAVHQDFNALGVLRGESWIFPPSKVHKRLSNGTEDNLWSYFRVVLDEPWERQGDS